MCTYSHYVIGCKESPKKNMMNLVTELFNWMAPSDGGGEGAVPGGLQGCAGHHQPALCLHFILLHLYFE